VGTLVPVTDAADLTERQKRHALQRKARFERLQRCDLPDRGQSSFFSWLRDFSLTTEVEPPVRVAGGATEDEETAGVHHHGE
jgi:hypothetical protein